MRWHAKSAVWAMKSSRTEIPKAGIMALRFVASTMNCWKSTASGVPSAMPPSSNLRRSMAASRRTMKLLFWCVDGDTLIARSERGQDVSLTTKQAWAYSVHERQPMEVAAGDRLLLTGNRRSPEFQATNGELVTVRNVEGRKIHLEDGRTIPDNYREFAHGYAVTAHRSQGKTVDGVIVSADTMKQELFYVAASRGREEIAIVTSDREQL